MKKRLFQELRQTMIIIMAIAFILVVMWLLSLMGNVMGWVWKNLLPLSIGFCVALVLKALANALFSKKD